MRFVGHRTLGVCRRERDEVGRGRGSALRVAVVSVRGRTAGRPQQQDSEDDDQQPQQPSPGSRAADVSVGKGVERHGSSGAWPSLPRRGEGAADRDQQASEQAGTGERSVQREEAWLRTSRGRELTALGRPVPQDGAVISQKSGGQSGTPESRPAAPRRLSNPSTKERRAPIGRGRASPTQTGASMAHGPVWTDWERPDTGPAGAGRRRSRQPGGASRHPRAGRRLPQRQAKRSRQRRLLRPRSRDLPASWRTRVRAPSHRPLRAPGRSQRSRRA